MTDRGAAAVQPTPTTSPGDYSHLLAGPHAFGTARYFGDGLQLSPSSAWVYHPQPAIAWTGGASAVIFGPW